MGLLYADNGAMARSIAPAGIALTADLSAESGIPYFLWDEPLTLQELRERLQTSEEERVRLLGKIMREAREPDVWLFTTPREVSRRWDALQSQLGRRREFWIFLLDQWRKLGLID